MVNTFGLIIANIKDNGLIIKCMGKVNLLGLMARNTKVLPPLIRKINKVDMLKTKKKVMVFSNGAMVEFTKDNGKMENNMEKAF